jgi:hypothetical protein
VQTTTIPDWLPRIASLPTTPQVNPNCPACGSPKAIAHRRIYRHCAACATIWLPSRRNVAYDDGYPAQRGHHDAAIARCKQLTLQSWLGRLGKPIARTRVLEVGFGGSATLEWMQQQGAFVYGQEPVAANRAAAIRRGIPAEHIKGHLRDFEGQVFDLVLYLDAFEHVLDPDSHLHRLDALSRTGSRAMLVLPVSDSQSRRLLGRWWPHDIDDHWVFYSTRGLTRIWGDFGWRLTETFRPWKYLSALTIVRHWEMKTGIRLPIGALKNAGVWLNFGERGLIFEKL